jgi:YidC/Oxa1 family membrane protein insertase
MEKYLAEQQRLYEEAEKARATTPKRQQPVSKQRAKKQGQQKPAPKPDSGDSAGNAAGAAT